MMQMSYRTRARVPGWSCAAVLVWACGTQSVEQPASESIAQLGASEPTASHSAAQQASFSEPPPNAPPPPAMCGDQNGGGDQHVDFAALRAAKIAEKQEVEDRQRALLELRYDLT